MAALLWRRRPISVWILDRVPRRRWTYNVVSHLRITVDGITDIKLRKSDISVDQYPYHQNHQPIIGQRKSKLTYLWSFPTPFGATFNSSSLPKIFCISPFGCGFGSPKSFTNPGEDMICLRRRESFFMLFLWSYISKRNIRLVKAYLIVASSFRPGHHEPAAISDSFPGLTERGVKGGYEAMGARTYVT